MGFKLNILSDNVPASAGQPSQTASKLKSTAVPPKTQVVTFPKPEVSGGFLVTTEVSDGSVNISIKYGTIYVNSYWIPSNQQPWGANGPVDESIGSLELGATTFVYMDMQGIFKREERATLSYFLEDIAPQDKEQPFKPFTSVICLAWINAEGKAIDLRPSFIQDVFAFLA